MTNWKPPIPIEPYPSESLGGFLIRYCETNGWPSYHHFIRLLGLSLSDVRYQKGDLRDIERKLNMGPRTLPTSGSRQGMAPGFLGGEILSRDHFHGQRRVCRRCLAETGYQRSYWELRFITRCHLHGETLQAECGCGEPLRWTDTSLSACPKCLSAVPQSVRTHSEPARPFQEWCLFKLGLIQSNHSLPQLDDLTLLDAIRAVEAVGLLETFGYGANKPSDTSYDAVDVREAGFAVIREDRIAAALALVVSRYRKRTGVLCPRRPAEALGWFGTFILNGWRHGQTLLLKSIVRSLSEALGYPVKNPEISSYVSLLEVARVAGRRVEELESGVEELGFGDITLRIGTELLIPVERIYDLRTHIGEW